MARKRIEWKPGDIFLIPLLDNTFGIGQIVSYEEKALNSIFCSLYSIRVNTDNINEKVSLDLHNLISAIFIIPTCLNIGKWQIKNNQEISNKEILVPILDKQRKKNFIGTETFENGIVEGFMNAFFKLCPWDDWFDPNFLDSLLISKDKRPSGLIYKNRKNVQN